MSGNDEARARTEKQTAQLQLLTAGLSAAVLCWYLIPEHRRQHALARLRHAAAPPVTRALAAAHQLAVRRAMARELATGVEDYALSERIHAVWQRWEGF